MSFLKYKRKNHQQKLLKICIYDITFILLILIYDNYYIKKVFFLVKEYYIINVLHTHIHTMHILIILLRCYRCNNYKKYRIRQLWNTAISEGWNNRTNVIVNSTLKDSSKKSRILTKESRGNARYFHRKQYSLPLLVFSLNLVTTIVSQCYCWRI